MRNLSTQVIWHDIECGSYAADLTVWEELAERSGGPVLDLGSGTGRVGLHLVRHGASVTGLDLDPGLVAAFEERAGGLDATAVLGDARRFDLGREFGLVLAPMQLLQLLSTGKEREGCLRCVAAHLRPGGFAAMAIVERLPPATDGVPALPDAREIDGWVYSSLPLETVVDGERLVVRRLRQTVSPDGGLSEEVDEIPLRALSADQLEREAEAAGLRSVDRIEIAATDDHVGSTVVVLKGE